MKPNPVHRLPAPLEAAVQRLKLAARDAVERTVESLGLAALAADPRLQELARDPDVAMAMRSSDFRGLMDHPKLLELAQDKELRARLQALDIEKTLRDVKGGAPSSPQP